MMYLLNIIDAITEADGIILFFVLLLLVIAIAMFYLLYTQNKEMKQELSKQSDTVSENITKVEKEEDLAKSDPVLVPLTEEKIPDKLEYTKALWQNDAFDLKSISQELETLPKERKVNMTPYEEEQEEKAIISYDELIHQKDNQINYSDEIQSSENDVLVKQVDLEQTSKVDLASSGREKSTTTPYEHEEDFLQSLKDLQNVLN